MKKGVLLLGATGSIGTSAARVLSAFPEKFRTVGVVARNSVGLLARRAAELGAAYAITTDSEREDELHRALPGRTICRSGMDAVLDLAVSPEVDIVLCAIVGTGGLLPVIAALRAGKRVALASKEVMVMAGELVNRELDASPGGEILPVDSEHSAIYQCLQGRRREEVRNLWLTASGGAFRDWTREQLQTATWEQALKHPTWSMGTKVTIDSASLMNKALEIVEAHHLFRMDAERLKVVIHPQSLVHSMVELADHSFIAQMSRPDMRFAIQYALTYPERLDSGLPELDFPQLGALTFSLPDREKYPALDFADNAVRRGGTLPAVMNAANEVAVKHFLERNIRFPEIWRLVGETMRNHEIQPQDSLETIQAADAWAREYAEGLLR